VPRGLDVHDVQQQVVVHALTVADQLRLYHPPIWVRHRLVKRVRTMTRRRLWGTVPDGGVEVSYEDGRGPAQSVWAAASRHSDGFDTLRQLAGAGAARVGRPPSGRRSAA
jgi:hypothetical protein